MEDEMHSPAFTGWPRTLKLGAGLLVGSLLFSACDQGPTEPSHDPSLEVAQPSAALFNVDQPSQCGTGDATVTVNATLGKASVDGGVVALYFQGDGLRCYAPIVQGTAQLTGIPVNSKVTGFVRYQVFDDFLKFATAPNPDPLLHAANVDPQKYLAPVVFSGSKCAASTYTGNDAWVAASNDPCTVKNNTKVDVKFQETTSRTVKLVGVGAGTEAQLWVVDPLDGDPTVGWDLGAGNYEGYAFVASTDATAGGSREMTLWPNAIGHARVEAIIGSGGAALWASGTFTNESTLELFPYAPICNTATYTDSNDGAVVPVLDFLSAVYNFAAVPSLAFDANRQITELLPDRRTTVVIALARLTAEEDVSFKYTHRYYFGSMANKLDVNASITSGVCSIESFDFKDGTVTSFCQELEPGLFEATFKVSLNSEATREAWRIRGPQDGLETSREDTDSSFIPFDKVDPANEVCVYGETNIDGGSLYRIG
jgi:hypothetical protein